MEDTSSPHSFQAASRKRSRATRRRTRRPRSRCSSRRRHSDRTDTQEEIPSFSPSIRVAGETGRIDAAKIGFKFPYQYFDDEQEVKQFWKHLGGAKREYSGTDHATMFSPFFGAASYNGDKAYPLQFRKRATHFDDSSRKLNAPLIGGSLIGKRGSGEVNGESKAWCRIQDRNSLSVNLTRAVNHRGEELLADEGWRETSFRKDSGSFLRGLDGKSNICPRNLSAEDFRTASRRFLSNLFQGISEEVRRAWLFANGFDATGQDGEDFIEGQTDSPESLSVQNLETYWEFTSENAFALLDRLEPLLKDYWKESKTGSHGFESALENNAKTIRIYKDSGTSIRIYAKEFDRLKIEVAHNPPGSRALIPRYSANSLDEFFEVTDSLAEKAAEEVNALLAFVEEWSTESPKERANSTEFLSRWFSMMGHTRRSTALLQMLRSSGRIVAGNSLPSSFRSVLKKAETLGLVSGRSAIYRAKREATENSSSGDLTSEEEGVSSLTHESDTQTANEGFVTRSLSMPESSRRRVPPSPPTIRDANCKIVPLGREAKNSLRTQVVHEVQDNSRPRLQQFATRIARFVSPLQSVL